MTVHDQEAGPGRFFQADRIVTAERRRPNGTFIAEKMSRSPDREQLSRGRKWRARPRGGRVGQGNRFFQTAAMTDGACHGMSCEFPASSALPTTERLWRLMRQFIPAPQFIPLPKFIPVPQFENGDAPLPSGLPGFIATAAEFLRIRGRGGKITGRRPLGGVAVGPGRDGWAGRRPNPAASVPGGRRRAGQPRLWPAASLARFVERGADTVVPEG